MPVCCSCSILVMLCVLCGDRKRNLFARAAALECGLDPASRGEFKQFKVLCEEYDLLLRILKPYPALKAEPTFAFDRHGRPGLRVLFAWLPVSYPESVNVPHRRIPRTVLGHRVERNACRVRYLLIPDLTFSYSSSLVLLVCRLLIHGAQRFCLLTDQCSSLLDLSKRATASAVPTLILSERRAQLNVKPTKSALLRTVGSPIAMILG